MDKKSGSEKINDKKADENILVYLAANEKLLSVLYEKYAVDFPEQSDFWTELALEEKLHFGWINALRKDLEKRKIFISQDRFKKEAVLTFRSHIQECLDRITDKENTISIVQALSTSLDIEQSLLEKKFFEVFESDSIEVRNTLENLRINTEEHASKVRRVWEQRKITGSSAMNSAAFFKNDGESW